MLASWNAPSRVAPDCQEALSATSTDSNRFCRCRAPDPSAPSDERSTTARRAMATQRSADIPVGCAVPRPQTPRFADGPAGLEACGTAGLETCATAECRHHRPTSHLGFLSRWSPCPHRCRCVRRKITIPSAPRMARLPTKIAAIRLGWPPARSKSVKAVPICPFFIRAQARFRYARG